MGFWLGCAAPSVPTRCGPRWTSCRLPTAGASRTSASSCSAGARSSLRPTAPPPRPPTAGGSWWWPPTATSAYPRSGPCRRSPGTCPHHPLGAPVPIPTRRASHRVGSCSRRGPPRRRRARRGPGAGPRGRTVTHVDSEPFGRLRAYAVMAHLPDDTGVAGVGLDAAGAWDALGSPASQATAPSRSCGCLPLAE